ncbi:autotransporter outer membrane beta-barrel domain-containing protein [Endomicrobium proavitum]|uniref:Autotransporter domain-containing protein n=1 Tax=Endomicrobium proavitum TaxID=1408281 RepID=A0A0G3WJR5_9BACT|nr:autotransporter outer membrane beta-barrel domain-containing protein [Endomicrobium proavitum]AKL97739.1 exported protein of unknown function [Endomicrobium proavitum]
MKKLLLALVISISCFCAAYAQVNKGGVFIANVLTVPSFADAQTSALNNLHQYKEANISAEVSLGSFKYKKENAIDADFDGKERNLLVGLDMYKTDSVTLGMLVKYSVTELDEFGDYSKITDIGVGGYLGYFFEKLDVKAVLRTGYQTYSNEKNTSVIKTSKGEFTGNSFMANVEAKYKIPVNEVFVLKPFVAFDAGANFYKGVSLDGFSLKGGSYFKSAVEGGAGIEAQLSGVFLYLDIGVGYLLSGNKNTITADVLGVETEIEGTKQSRVAAKTRIGAEVDLNSDVALFFNAGYSESSSFRNVFAAIGVNCKIGE